MTCPACVGVGCPLCGVSGETEGCAKCSAMGCRLCDHAGPSEQLPLGEWAEGPSNQGDWCKCCLGQLIDDISMDAHETFKSELSLRFLVTLAQRPGRYVREVPIDTTGWSGTGRCWPRHPVNLRPSTRRSRRSHVASTSRRCHGEFCISDTRTSPILMTKSISLRRFLTR